jgi:glycine/D-amino acid oxidase-like deaminating enzyme
VGVRAARRKDAALTSCHPASALERRYRDRSLWLDGLAGSLAPRLSLHGDTTCDVAIVGAGFTGLWTAYYLKRHQADLRIVVVEREIAGFGPSGRNAGWASAGIAGSWKVYARRHGMDAVLRAERETFRTVDEIAEVTELEGIQCHFVKDGMLVYATSEPQAARLRADLASARAHGVAEQDLWLVDPAETGRFVQVPGYRLGLYSPHCARIDPARLVRGLADACERAGVTIYEGTAALELGPGRVRCREGVVKAEHVLRATESYTTQLPGEQLRYLPLYSLMIATEPLGDAVWKELGWREGLMIRDRHHLFFYAQPTADGRVTVGGRGAPYRLGSPICGAAEQNPPLRRQLERTLRRHFPSVGDAAVTHHWGGPLAVPRDWSMGVVYDRSTGVGWAGGYSGHGVVAANISGRTLADLVLGRESELVRMPWVGHVSRRWEPEPLRFLASRAIVGVLGSADRYEDRVGNPARRTALVAPFLPPT